MKHPFAPLFEKALAKSSEEENLVLKEAVKLIEKGYRREEICAVLTKLAIGRIDDTETTRIEEAIEEVCEADDDE